LSVLFVHECSSNRSCALNLSLAVPMQTSTDAIQ
jgi:hypothetical protein